MTNSEALRAKIKEEGVTLQSLADRLGITRQALANKIDGKSDFRVTEMVKLSQALHLTARERNIFFLGWER